MDTSEQNETKAMYLIAFGASSTVNKYCAISVAMTTLTYQNYLKFTSNPIYLANEYGDPWFLALKPLLL